MALLLQKLIILITVTNSRLWLPNDKWGWWQKRKNTHIACEREVNMGDGREENKIGLGTGGFREPPWAIPGVPGLVWKGTR